MSRQRLFCITKGEEEMNLIKILECSHYKEQALKGNYVFDYRISQHDSLGICLKCKVKLMKVLK